MQRGLGVSPVDLYVDRFRGVPDGPKFSTCKLGVKINDRALLGTVDVSTPYPTLAGWVSRMVLASCGSTLMQGYKQFELACSRI